MKIEVDLILKQLIFVAFATINTSGHGSFFTGGVFFSKNNAKYYVNYVIFRKPRTI